MNSSAKNNNSSRRSTRQKRLRYTSWAAVIMAVAGFPPALLLFIWATASCWGSSHEVWWCEIFATLPWIGLALSLAAYVFVLWLIHQLGRELQTGQTPGRNSWRQTKQGYKWLDKGHHRLVRRVHRVSSLAFAGLSAYISFQYFEADTLVNLAVALLAYVVGELFNWSKFTNIKY